MATKTDGIQEEEISKLEEGTLGTCVARLRPSSWVAIIQKVPLQLPLLFLSSARQSIDCLIQRVCLSGKCCTLSLVCDNLFYSPENLAYG